MSYNVGVVGATGMVGEVFLQLMLDREFPVKELRLFASESSKGKIVQWNDQEISLKVLEDGCFDGLDVVFFSSGDSISKEWAPKAVEAGAFAIDNSAAYRMDDNTPLVVPEVNSDLIPTKDKPSIIANPNCSTIQLVVALKPLAEAFGLEKVNVSTYQAVSGAGKSAQGELVEQLTDILNQEDDIYVDQFAQPIAFNAIPQIGSQTGGGFFTEETKIMNETKKILGLPELKVSAFCVRIPSLNGHSEAAWVTLGKSVERSELVSCLNSAEGIEFFDTEEPKELPTVAHLDDTDPVWVGRLHQDPSQDNTWMMWVVADNIRKGAALNGIQIAEKIFL
ncbi:MAG: aspartate-semialdehyde dehydrogenase [Bdellovibrionales bacterium]|nr:aspartate-semialdehyde dehydrogenase [Bdellovibrionales bacterium]